MWHWQLTFANQFGHRDRTEKSLLSIIKVLLLFPQEFLNVELVLYHHRVNNIYPTNPTEIQYKQYQ